MSGARWAYLFEAKGIQKYILSGGKLVDMAGGSALIANAVRSDKQDLLQIALKQTEFAPEFSRRAGASFMLHFPDKKREQFNRFRTLWQLVFSLYAPGVEYTERLATAANDADALDATYRQNAGLRNNTMASLLPVAGPLAARSPRTGLPAKKRMYGEGLDLPTLHRRVSGKNGRQVPGFMSNETENFCWPVHMEKPDHSTWKEAEEPLFPFKGEDQRVGIVHADISGLGQLYQDFGRNRSIAERLELARAIEGIIECAAQTATMDVLAREFDNGSLPARPILLGGDDLTIIVRADLAIDYARCFLEALETGSKNNLKEVLGTKEETVLTACAGIAFGRFNQPFLHLSALAEELCSFAKKHVKADLAPSDPIPSAIAFYRQTTSLIESNVEEILGREATDQKRRLLTAQPYLVGKISKEGLFRLDHLEKLKDWLSGKEVSHGRPRKLRTLLLNDPATAERDYRRWREILENRGQQNALDEKLDMFSIKTGSDLPFVKRQIAGLENVSVTPLFDALEWRALGIREKKKSVASVGSDAVVENA